MELNNTNITETEPYSAGTSGHVAVYDRAGSGSIHLETMTAKGWKRLTAPIDDAMIDKEGADGARIPIHLIPGVKLRFVNDGFTSVWVEYVTWTS